MLLKRFLTLPFVLFVSLFSFAQDADEEGYVEIPEITEKIKVTGKGPQGSAVSFRYLPEYEFQGSIAFGSYLKVHVSGIEQINQIGDDLFLFYKQNIVRASDKKVMIETGWTAEKMSEEQKAKDGDTYFFDATWKIGTITTPGEYIWEIYLVDFCTKKETKMAIPVTVSLASNIAVNVSSNVGVGTVYFWNADREYIYSGSQIYLGKYELKVSGITGFTYDEGLYKVGVSHMLKEADGDVIFNVDDLATGKDAFVESSDGSLVLSPIVELKSDVQGKVLEYDVVIWDKINQDNYIKVRTKFYVK